MVLNVDDAIPPEALDELKGIAGIETAFVVSLPQTSPQRPLFPVGITCALLSLVPPDRDPRHARGLGARRQRRLGHLHGVACPRHVDQTSAFDPVRQLRGDQA